MEKLQVSFDAMLRAILTTFIGICFIVSIGT